MQLKEHFNGELYNGVYSFCTPNKAALPKRRLKLLYQCVFKNFQINISNYATQGF